MFLITNLYISVFGESMLVSQVQILSNYKLGTVYIYIYKYIYISLYKILAVDMIKKKDLLCKL